MATYLICSSPIYGHVVPQVEIGRYLVGQGHTVRMLTGSRFKDIVVSAGLEFVALPEACDFDDRDLDRSFPARTGKKGLDRLRFDMEAVFISALPHQYRALREEFERSHIDAVLAESGFVGAIAPLLRKDPRPPILYTGIIPLAFSSRDTAPFGLALPPKRSRAGAIRNLVLTAVMHKVVFRPTHREASRQMKAATGVPLPVHFLDSASLADRFLQFTCPGFEYPRSDQFRNVRFVGPVLPRGDGGFTPPPWWKDLHDGRPVVHVTQGTIDNKDPGRLILPTLRALANQDVLVVATTGGAPLPPGRVPPNARVADFIPHEYLLPEVDLLITNGGYGGTQRALALGLPVIVAGDREDKPEVAARVAWAGVGINLRSGSPKPAAIRRAVRKALSDPSYREAAGRLAEEYSHYDALPLVAQELATAQAGPPQGREGSPSAPQRRAGRRLAAVSAVQLALGVAGLRRALRERTAYDIGFLRGSTDTIERDQWITGTNLSAPGVMLVLQAACTAALLRRPGRAAAKTLGILGAIMAGGYPAERSVRASWRTRSGPAPLTAAATLLAALMAVQGLRAARR
jgi:UDP:flavonoid glycosyltransferase YjiC (YdhE family)